MFANETLLREHNVICQEKEITNDKFTCDLCSYSTNKKVNLDRHRRTHTGEKPFACDYCNYRASQNSTLKTHMRTHQKGLNIKSVGKSTSTNYLGWIAEIKKYTY